MCANLLASKSVVQFRTAQSDMTFMVDLAAGRPKRRKRELLN